MRPTKLYELRNYGRDNRIQYKKIICTMLLGPLLGFVRFHSCWIALRIMEVVFNFLCDFRSLHMISKVLIRSCQLSYNILGIFVTTSFYKFFAVKLIMTFGIFHDILVIWKSGFSNDSCSCKYFPWWHSEFESFRTIVTIKLSTTKFERPYLYWKRLMEFQRYDNVH